MSKTAIKTANNAGWKKKFLEEWIAWEANNAPIIGPIINPTANEIPITAYN